MDDLTGPSAPTLPLAGIDPAETTDRDDQTESVPRVEVRRSAKRSRTVSARMEQRADGEVMVLMIPARSTQAEERRWTEEMLAKLARRARRRGSGAHTDAALERRARTLAQEHDLPQPASVRWVTNQEQRWGSCTPARGTIRISHRLQEVPTYVLDAVLVHELAHLVHRDHGREFRRLTERFARTERATGYLEALSRAAGWAEEPGEPGESPGRAADVSD